MAMKCQFALKCESWMTNICVVEYIYKIQIASLTYNVEEHNDFTNVAQ